MKVYLLFSGGSYADGNEIEGIFTSEELAIKKAAPWVQPEGWTKSDSSYWTRKDKGHTQAIWIEEHEVINE